MAPRKPTAAEPNTKAKRSTDGATKTKNGVTNASVKKTAPKKTAAKKAASKKAATLTAAEKKKTAAKVKAEPKAPKTTTKKTAAKRKAEDEPAATTPAVVKKPKIVTKGEVINEPPTQALNVYVFGEGSAGELGLGSAKGTKDVKRPRLNPFLNSDKVGVVQISAGGMHAAALTRDNKILTWGVNDQGALGRNTEWDGGLRDMDAKEDSDDESEDSGLNPHESTPGEVDFSGAELPENTRWTQVAAGDSFTVALTDDGRVYGWGTFRANDGVLGFTTDTKIATRPVLIPELKNIVSLSAGSNHALALNTKGAVFAWGSGQQNQLGRRIVERNSAAGLVPREFGLPKGVKNGIKFIATGAYHSFAVAKDGKVYGWGANSFGQTGCKENRGEDEGSVLKPTIIDGLRDKDVVSIEGGNHHSLCATANGDCLVWGRIDNRAMGMSADEIAALSDDVVDKDDRGNRRIISIPQRVSAIQGHVSHVATSSDQCVVVTKEGKAWSWGFSANYQTGQGTYEDVIVAAMVDNSAIRDKKLTGSGCGAQYGFVYGPAEAMVNGVN